MVKKMKTPTNSQSKTKLQNKHTLKQIIFLESFCDVLNEKRYGFFR